MFVAPAAARDTLALWSVAMPEAPEALWEQANTAYTNGDYPSAIAGYDSIRRAGYASALLYYNMGNACYKDGRIGGAILNYNKALRLSPGDGNIRHNLAVANTQIRDRIDAVPEFFVKTWARRLMYSAGADGWAVRSLVFFAAALGLTLLYLLGARMNLRKAGFYGAIVLLALSIGSLTFASIQRKKIRRPDEAVVMITAAPVKSEPNTAGRDVFVLHEGTKVRLVGTVDNWCEIVLADGKQGWIDRASIGVID
jgi:tetratricopeptide (TPR) repeat protein